MKRLLLTVFLLIFFFHFSARAQDTIPAQDTHNHNLHDTIPPQEHINDILDSLYIHEVENKHEKDKVLHAEPLYIDLIRDLGARKGEREWNVAYGMKDRLEYTEYEALIEYEFAPIDRLGIEIELPFTFYSASHQEAEVPESKLNGLKLALQYSFFVSEKLKTSMAIGYLHEFETPSFQKMGRTRLHYGNLYSPFFVGAKRFGNNFHFLVYTGPLFEQSLVTREIHKSYQINSNFHYMITGTRNFIGLEINKLIDENRVFHTVFRPQMRIGLADNLIVGIVVGIPSSREHQRFSNFIRLIYEPKHKHLPHHHHYFRIFSKKGQHKKL